MKINDVFDELKNLLATYKDLARETDKLCSILKERADDDLMVTIQTNVVADILNKLREISNER